MLDVDMLGNGIILLRVDNVELSSPQADLILNLTLPQDPNIVIDLQYSLA